MRTTYSVRVLIKSNLFQAKRMIIRADHDNSAVVILFHNTLILPALAKQMMFFKPQLNVSLAFLEGFH